MDINSINALSSTNAKESKNTNKVNNNGNFSSYFDSKKDVTLDEIFEKASKTYGVDVNLLRAMAKQESDFTNDCTSHSGAMGIMQLMPETAKYLGVENAYDPEQNIMGGAKFISQLLKQFDGDVNLALAAYNAGPNNVIKYNGIPPFAETIDYVKKITNYYKTGVTIPDSRNHAYLSSSREVIDNITKDASSIANAKSETTTVSEARSTDELRESLKDLMNSLSPKKDKFSYADYSRFMKIYLDSVAINAFEDKDKEKDEKDKNPFDDIFGNN